MALIAGFAVAVIATPVAAWIAIRLGLVDEPGPLKVHARSVPYLGGVAVLVALAGPAVGARASLLIPLALACALGLADDATDLPPVVRLAVEVGIGVTAAIAVGHHDAGRVVLGVVVVLVLVNAMNLLDGLDGLAAGVTVAAAAGFYVVLSGAGATLALALAGAGAGFLVWNAPPARVYLGDSGSYLIGTALAMLFLAAAQRPAEVVSGACLFLAVPVADTTIAVVRRLRAGRPLLRGDRGHVYDQLVDRGWTAPAAVLACVAVQATLTVAGIGIAQLSGGAAIVVTVLTVAGVGAVAIVAFTSPLSWTPEQ
ncbi:MAG: UDP-GlcNAc:undecaprenyl-phosphate/decaprenyl-phosphate GlcNAc-phosphate transferase [Actinomycetota bacterium]|jgi:UDP-GlcNAc:undecaprenyl-phosphate GlcNAc-1-phosphate transferase|nr:UDP-GlcNAc:undecaprenyl-phosphate/decaprenyl-phosphate GlcNAc-phosphate transferase [Actinomycetota bacterium]